mmetsp:Transcript_30314/g.63147  ORF Transcript_30314/g.63147 Transcript_30314/m.63147 type:complete len:222 (+) Transcript_30314:1595-2260(+)
MDMGGHDLVLAPAIAIAIRKPQVVVVAAILERTIGGDDDDDGTTEDQQRTLPPERSPRPSPSHGRSAVGRGPLARSGPRRPRPRRRIVCGGGENVEGRAPRSGSMVGDVSFARTGGGGGSGGSVRGDFVVVDHAAFRVVRAVVGGGVGVDGIDFGGSQWPRERRWQVEQNHGGWCHRVGSGVDDDVVVMVLVVVGWRRHDEPISIVPRGGRMISRLSCFWF